MTVVAAALAVAGCSGTGDVNMDGALKLSADKEVIAGSGSDRATFTVTKGDAVVTGKADIYMISDNGKQVRVKQTGNSFASRAEGTYKFEAVYTSDKEYVSDAVTVKVEKYVSEEVFYRRLFAMQFTSTGCQACPSLTESLDNLPAKYAERLVRASFHTNFSASYPDPMHIPVTFSYMVDLLNNPGGLPSFYLDMRPETRVISEQPKIIEQIESALVDYPAVCGVKTASVHNRDKDRLEITFTVKASLAGEYRIAPFIIENGIVSDQTGNASYVHNTTVRKALALSLIGDKLGAIEAGEETTKEYLVPLEAGWNTENLRVVVCVLDTVDGKNFIGNNSDECGIDGQTDYMYNE